MNLKEALQALAEGEKVRKTKWRKNRYIFIHNDAEQGIAIRDNYGYDARMIGNDWELYEEYNIAFYEAIYYMYKYNWVFESMDENLYKVENGKLSRSVYFNSDGKNSGFFSIYEGTIQEIEKLKFREWKNES